MRTLSDWQINYWRRSSLNNTTSEISDQRYEPREIEAYWQKEWANQGL